MIDDPTSETSHERRITWSLMAVVIAFVVVMACIVLWITSSLIRNEFSQAEASPWPTSTPVSGTPRQASATATATEGIATRTEAPATRAVSDPAARPTWTTAPTWTPIPVPRRYVRFNTYRVSKSKITMGECVQIRWDAEFAVRLDLYRDNDLLLEDAPASTTIDECPNRTGYVVYRLIGVNAYEETNFVQLQVRVDPVR